MNAPILIKELNLIYSDHIRSAFEVYEAGDKKLLGHVTFRLQDEKVIDYCYTPFGLPRGHCHTTLLGALKETFDVEILLHFTSGRAS